MKTPDKLFTFIHVPKTGGRSIRVALSLAGLGCFAGPGAWREKGGEAYTPKRNKNAFILDGHAPAILYRDHHPEKFSKSFKFAFVRNPWDRVVSTFFWILDEKYDEIHPHRKDRPLFSEIRSKFGKTKNFKAFLKQGYLNKLRNLRLLRGQQFGVVKPQWFFVTYDKKDLAVDFLGRFESLQKDFDTICDRIGLDRIKLPHEHKTRHKHYSKYYNREAQEIVGNMYWRDIDLFNYTFEKQ